MNIKKCGCCKIEKNIDEFHADKARKGGLKSACKSCIIIRSHKNYLKHKNHILKYGKEYQIKKIKELKEKYQIEKTKCTNQLISQGYKIIPIQENNEKLYLINKDSDIVKINTWNFFLKNKKLNYKIIKKRINYYGYYVVSISKEFRVHQLIAITYLNHIQQNHRLVVDHIDGNKLNNHVSNLQIVTQFQNLIKGRYHKSKDPKWIKWIESIKY